MPVAEARQERAAQHAQRLRVRRAVLCVLALALSAWLVGAAQSPSSGPIERALLLLIAFMVPFHVIFWQLGFGVLDRVSKWPRPLALPIFLIAFAASPMGLYPLGAIAIVASLFTGGGVAAPALALSGLILLSPIILLLSIAMLFVIGGYKGG